MYYNWNLWYIFTFLLPNCASFVCYTSLAIYHLEMKMKDNVAPIQLSYSSSTMIYQILFQFIMYTCFLKTFSIHYFLMYNENYFKNSKFNSSSLVKTCSNCFAFRCCLSVLVPLHTVIVLVGFLTIIIKRIATFSRSWTLGSLN